MNTSPASVQVFEYYAPPPTPRWARYWAGLRRFVRQKPLGAAGAAIILVLVICALIPQYVAPQAYDDFDISNRVTGPSASHLFGTDRQGRDVFSRVVFGARSSIVIGFGAVGLATLGSLVLGVASGYKGGWLDAIVQRFVDMWQAFPGLIFVLFASAVFGAGTKTLIFTIAVLLTAGASRLVRGQTIAVKAQAFVESARVLGASDLRIAVVHIVPNVLPIVLINISLQIGAVMLIESALSFLGFGVPPPFPSWGRMLKEAQGDMQEHPYLALFPGAAIALTVYAFNMLGDALRDVLDPRMRGSR